MIPLALICVLGLVAGFLLLVRVPLCGYPTEGRVPRCSIIVPARNEAHTLPTLLRTIDCPDDNSCELLVVDDHSTDGTATVAEQQGARVISAPPLQVPWTGKTAACVAGAGSTREGHLLFLDADTWFAPGGLTRLLRTFSRLSPRPVALSVLPYHVTYALYEELSMFFNLMMAFGVGGFGMVGHGRLSGQSLLLSRELYARSGTHAAVRGEILENLALSRRITQTGGRCVCLGGRGVLQMRMFPNGLKQLCEGWTKAFASGAAASGGATLMIAITWLTALYSAFLWMLSASGTELGFALVVYLSFVLQTTWFAKQIGSFRWYTCAFFPVPLTFFFIIFALSLKRRVFRQPVMWKGRQL